MTQRGPKINWGQFWADVALMSSIVLFAAMILAWLMGCTRISYNPQTGEAAATSVLQKRTLTVETYPNGDIRALRYSSGTDPVIINTPYGTVGGSAQ